MAKVQRYVGAQSNDQFTRKGDAIVGKLSAWGFFVPVAAAAMALASCNQTNTTPTPPAEALDNRAADESAIRALDASWSKASADKDAQKAASYYADSGMLLLPGAPVANGKDAILKAWTGMLAAPGNELTFAPTKIEVSRAGDLAYDFGEYEMKSTDKKGKAQTVKAKYVVVWGKQADGGWKVLVDTPTTTTP
jgi:uncharacterized protein (TIGR02246 family)